MELIVRNVVEALHSGTGYLSMTGKITPSRVGSTIEAPCPVYTTYQNPNERVLFAPARDANPYLHFFEALWMLAGRDDLKFLAELTSNFRKYSDDGVIMQGSYGARWRVQFVVDQIREVIRLLTKDPDSRRAVISMWDPDEDWFQINSTDIPCNTTIYFKIRGGHLNMTVCNRSNDMLWGAYGANAVHMSMLQEYVAGHLKIPVGVYIQQSDSFHVYTTGPGGELWAKVQEAWSRRELWHCPYTTGEVAPYPMFVDTTPEAWDKDLHRFFSMYDHNAPIVYGDFVTPFFRMVVTPMWLSFTRRDFSYAQVILASDWRKACTEWLTRRVK